jgi:CheY-like chemotaxis protein
MWGQVEDKLRSAEAGFEWHLTKPIDAMQLKTILDRIQEKRA